MDKGFQKNMLFLFVMIADRQDETGKFEFGWGTDKMFKEAFETKKTEVSAM